MNKLSTLFTNDVGPFVLYRLSNDLTVKDYVTEITPYKYNKNSNECEILFSLNSSFLYDNLDEFIVCENYSEKPIFKLKGKQLHLYLEDGEYVFRVLNNPFINIGFITFRFNCLLYKII